jgi:hypothetical protein
MVDGEWVPVEGRRRWIEENEEKEEEGGERVCPLYDGSMADGQGDERRTVPAVRIIVVHVRRQCD